MSVHEAVNCDVCIKSSFSGNRYKCLICYDYDLCSNCFEAGATSVQHLTQHPMQCVLARADYDLYYAGEESSKNHMPCSFTCPFCGHMGHSDSTLSAHVSNEHAEDSYEVVCPICAATPGGDPNRVTQDFIGHLMMEHRVSGQDFDESSQAVLPATSTEPQIPQNVVGSGARGIGRTHSVAHQYHSPGSTGSSLSPSGGQESETIESMSELLYQLSALKGRSSTIQSISTQLQQLELQLQSTRHQLEILPFRTHSHQAASRQQQCPVDGTKVTTLSHGGPVSVGFTAANPEFNGVMKDRYLLSQDDSASMTELELENADDERAGKALFVQELLITALVEDLALNNNLSNGEETAEKSETAEETYMPVSSPLLSASGHLPKSNCDKKLVSTTCKEYVARETTLAPGGIVTSHQSHDRLETHTPKIRLHLPQKVNKHKSGKEMPPPKK